MASTHAPDHFLLLVFAVLNLPAQEAPPALTEYLGRQIAHDDALEGRRVAHAPRA
jgi:hypothetical protein